MTSDLFSPALRLREADTRFPQRGPRGLSGPQRVVQPPAEGEASSAHWSWLTSGGTVGLSGPVRSLSTWLQIQSDHDNHVPRLSICCSKSSQKETVPRCQVGGQDCSGGHGVEAEVSHVGSGNSSPCLQGRGLRRDGLCGGRNSRLRKISDLGPLPAALWFRVGALGKPFPLSEPQFPPLRSGDKNTSVFRG